MTQIERLQVGPRMSQAVIHNGVVYLAGQVASDAPGRSVQEQTQNILQRIDALLAAAGTDKSKLLSARVWLTDLRRLDEMNEVWLGWVFSRRHPYPGRRGSEARGARVYGRDCGGGRSLAGSRVMTEVQRIGVGPHLSHIATHKGIVHLSGVVSPGESGTGADTQRARRHRRAVTKCRERQIENPLGDRLADGHAAISTR